jgi:hypothetical protein
MLDEEQVFDSVEFACQYAYDKLMAIFTTPDEEDTAVATNGRYVYFLTELADGSFRWTRGERMASVAFGKVR